jgi:hypothetical protein
MTLEQFNALGAEVAQQVQHMVGLNRLTFLTVDTGWNGTLVHGTMALDDVAQTYSLPSVLLQQLLPLPVDVARPLLTRALEATARRFIDSVQEQAGD